jgi:hypothetical protein
LNFERAVFGKTLGSGYVNRRREVPNAFLPRYLKADALQFWLWEEYKKAQSLKEKR